MSTNAQSATTTAALPTYAAADSTTANATAHNQPLQHDGSSLTEALALRRNLLQSLWIGVRQLPRGRRIVLMVRLAVSFAQIVAFIPILALPGSHRVSPSHENGRVCDPDSLFKYLVVHIVRLALDIPVELYLGLSPHRTRRGRRAGPEARAIAERDRPLGSEYLDIKVGKISTLLGIASLVIFFVGNAIVYSSTECSQKPAEAVPLFWTALASLIVVYIFILEIALLAFLIVCALPLLIMVMRALGLTHRLPQRELHPETGKIDQKEVDKRVKLVYYTPAEEDEDDASGGETAGAEQHGQDEQQHHQSGDTATQQTDATAARPGLGSRQSTQQSSQTATHPTLGRFGRLTRLLIARRRSETSASRLHGDFKPATASLNTTPPPGSTPQAEVGATATRSPTNLTDSRRGRKLKYPLHPLPAHRATCPICLCDFEEPQPDEEPEPEPLRLLECGHVMHRGCVDQWLTTVSGRCPVCQKPVIPEVAAATGATGGADGGAIGQLQPGIAEQSEGSSAATMAAPSIDAQEQRGSVASQSRSARSEEAAAVVGSTANDGSQAVESHELQPLDSSTAGPTLPLQQQPTPPSPSPSTRS